MYTIALLVVFLTMIVRGCQRIGGNFPDLVVHYLFLTPFLPMLSVFNHNLDNDRFDPVVRVLPFYCLTALLLCSFLSWTSKRREFPITKISLFLSLYVLFSFLQIYFCEDPTWALTHWTWAIPAYLLFYLGGCLATEESLTRSKGVFWATIGYLCINQLLVAYGLLTGKATDVFETRNFGSIYASNAVLTFLSAYAGVAWLQARNELWAMLLLLCLTFLSTLFSLSRTGVFTTAMLAGFLITLRFEQARRVMFACVFSVFFVVIAVQVLEQLTSLDITSQLSVGWQNRFLAGGLEASYRDSMESRNYQFDEDWRNAWESNILLGVGFGHYHIVSRTGYTNCHNLFLMEWYENGLLTTAILYVFLISGLVSSMLLVVRSGRQYWSLAFCVPTFLAIAHTTGANLSSRNSADAYFTTAEGWMLCYLIGIVTYAIPSKSFFTRAGTSAATLR